MVATTVGYCLLFEGSAYDGSSYSGGYYIAYNLTICRQADGFAAHRTPSKILKIFRRDADNCYDTPRYATVRYAL